MSALRLGSFESAVPRFMSIVAAALVGLTVMLGQANKCNAQSNPPIPDRAKDIRVDEKLGAYLRLDTIFQNERGLPMRLSDIVADRKPMLLTLNYSGCPGLCVAQLDGLVEGLNELSSLRAGSDFKMVSISIDPTEKPETAAATKEKYTKVLRDKHDSNGWYFLVGDRSAIARVADEVGFRYSYDEKHDRFNHAAVAIAISPEGKITRYLYEVGFQPDTIKMAMIEASEGRIGSSLDAFVLWCMEYNADENRYSASARKILAFSAGAFAIALFVCSVPFWFGTRKSKPVGEAVEQASYYAKPKTDELPFAETSKTESQESQII